MIDFDVRMGYMKIRMNEFEDKLEVRVVIVCIQYSICIVYKVYIVLYMCKLIDFNIILFI